MGWSNNRLGNEFESDETNIIYPVTDVIEFSRFNYKSIKGLATEEKTFSRRKIMYIFRHLLNFHFNSTRNVN